MVTAASTAGIQYSSAAARRLGRWGGCCVENTICCGGATPGVESGGVVDGTMSIFTVAMIEYYGRRASSCTRTRAPRSRTAPGDGARHHARSCCDDRQRRQQRGAAADRDFEYLQ
eukprot:SAG31_NODE_191_length_20809_cov_64.613761_8_plen_115_part_00